MIACSFCRTFVVGCVTDPQTGSALCPSCVAAGAVLALALSSDGVTWYTVRGSTTGPWTCTCAAGARGVECRHVRVVRHTVRPVEPQGVPGVAPTWPVRGGR